MTKLKTLNDLKFTLSNLKLATKDKLFQNYEVDGSAVFVDPRELKAEAVKWVKECRKEPQYYVPEWILQFFNLTDEDISNAT